MGPDALLLVPPIARWGFLLHWVLAFAGGIVFGAVPTALLLAFARLGAPGLHWTEKARRLAPFRMLLGIELVVGPLMFAYAAQHAAGSFFAVSPVVDAWGALAAAFAGVLCMLQIVDRFLRRKYAFSPAQLSTSAARILVTRAIAAPPFVLVIWVRPTGAVSTVLLVVFAVAMLVLTSTKVLTVLRALGVVVPTGERWKRCVESAAARMGVAPPRSYEMKSAMANAMASPFEGAVAATAGALQMLDDDQLTAVACHEIAHLHEGRAAPAVRLMPSVAFLVMLAVITHSEDQLVNLGSLAGFLVVFILVRRFKVAREKGADHAATEHTPEPAVYARALLRLYEANLFPASTKGGSHPSLYDRLLAAGVNPDFPRPAPPRQGGALFAIVIMLIVGLALDGFRSDRREASTWHLALFGSSTAQMWGWSERARMQGNTAAELDFIEATLDPFLYNNDYGGSIAAVEALARRGACDRAARLAERHIMSHTGSARAARMISKCRGAGDANSNSEPPDVPENLHDGAEN